MSQHSHTRSERINLDDTLPIYNSVSTASSQATFASQSHVYTGQGPEKHHLSAVGPLSKPWTPIPLRKWFAVVLLTCMLLVAVALQIALHFSNRSRGWSLPPGFGVKSGVLHYVYTLPPVAVAMTLVALWAWTDVGIKKMQPYIDLAHGHAPASRTLLLDYTTQHAAIVSISAWHHSHYIVAFSSLMVLTGLAIQPLAASLFTVKDTWGNVPNINVTTYETLGLNPSFDNLTAFSTAAGFVQSNALYNIPPPNFISGIWSISVLDVPSDQVANGTMFANTTSVKSLGNCKAGDSSALTPFSNGTGFTISGSSNGCSVNIPIQTLATTQYGVDVVTCPDSPPPDPFKPVVFWTLHRPDSSADPSYSLTGNLLTADVLGVYSGTNNITSSDGPMQGRAMNGVAFDLTGADIFAQDRAQASKTGLTAAIVQKAQQSPGGLDNQIKDSGIVNTTENLYELYLSLVARNNYFVPLNGFTEVEIKTFQSRLWVVDATADILTGVLIAFAVLGAAIHVLHYRMRALVVIPHRPGSLASAAAFTARSNVGDVLDGHLDEAALARVLKHKLFRIDKGTNTIVMEGEPGYEGEEALLHPRRSVVERLRRMG